MATQPPIGQQAGTATKPTAVPKEPKAKKEPSGVARPRFARPDDNLIITVLKPHAKTGNAGKRFDTLKTGMTVKEYRDILTVLPSIVPLVSITGSFAGTRIPIGN